tara:strand:+ start:12085 stop:13122 length:1038 start_codon:yes stop_codon:yes gene_type:complete
MSRLDKLKEQHPDLNISLIDIISHLDPTDSYKYLDFLIKNFKRDNEYYSPNKEEFMGLMGVFLFGSGEIESLNEFERHSRANRIKNKDISQYTNFLELNDVVKAAEEIENRKKLEKEILKIYEDDTWFILTPLSFEASQAYGANTKWCVTQERYWEQYLATHRLIYVLNKKTDTKIAFSRDFIKGKFQAWDQLDKEVDPMFINFIPDELFLKIRKELQEDKTTGELTGLGDTVKDIIKLSDYPELRTPNDIAEESLRIWGRTTASRDVIDAFSNDSRHDMHSNEIVTRIRTLMGNQPRQPIRRRSIIDQLSPTINNNPNVNYTSTYDDYVRQFMGGSETYLDDLP